MLGHEDAFQATLKFYNSDLQLGKNLFPKQLLGKQDKTRCNDLQNIRKYHQVNILNADLKYLMHVSTLEFLTGGVPDLVTPLLV